MKTLAAIGVLAPTVALADGLSFQFTPGPAFPAPSSYVTVSIYGHFPANGTQVPWTTPPGTGQVGEMSGLLSAVFDLNASAGSWSNLYVPPPLFWCGFGGCATGQISGSSVNHIAPGVAFNPPVAGPDLLFWEGRLTLPSTLPPSGQITLDTSFVPLGNPPLRGIEVALSGIVPGTIVSHFVTASDAHAVLQVPAPAVPPLVLLACLAYRRRRAPSRTLAPCH